MSTTDPGGRDAVRERVMQQLRAGIRERQIRGESPDAIYAWIDHQRMDETITEEEGGRCRTRHPALHDAGRAPLSSQGEPPRRRLSQRRGGRTGQTAQSVAE